MEIKGQYSGYSAELVAFLWEAVMGWVYIVLVTNSCKTCYCYQLVAL